MTLEQIEEALTGALRLRSPVFEPGTAPRAKVSAIEDHMLLSANVNGDLVAARHWLRMLEAKLGDEWEAMTGWEVALRKARNRASKAEINEAKIATAPAKFQAGRKARRLRESVDDQIVRLEREERVCSRAYTMLSGG